MERKQQVRLCRNGTTPCAAQARRQFPQVLRGVGGGANLLLSVCLISAFVGTNDEGCLQLSFIGGAKQNERGDQGKRHGVNRRVCDV
jgi:hypothetical protein